MPPGWNTQETLKTVTATSEGEQQMDTLSNKTPENEQINILISEDGTKTEITPSNGKWFSLEELQEMVKGYIEAVPCPYDDHCMLVNEMGKFNEDMSVNAKATELYYEAGGWEVVVGPAVVLSNSVFGSPE